MREVTITITITTTIIIIIIIIQFFIINVLSQQLQGQLQTQHSVVIINCIMEIIIIIIITYYIGFDV
jgi:hypothetical protein